MSNIKLSELATNAVGVFVGYTGSQGVIGYTGSRGNKNVDGGGAFSIYLTSQTVNGGSANG